MNGPQKPQNVVTLVLEVTKMAGDPSERTICWLRKVNPAQAKHNGHSAKQRISSTVFLESWDYWGRIFG